MQMLRLNSHTTHPRTETNGLEQVNPVVYYNWQPENFLKVTQHIEDNFYERRSCWQTGKAQKEKQVAQQMGEIIPRDPSILEQSLRDFSKSIFIRLFQL